jgi:hypothetical protein
MKITVFKSLTKTDSPIIRDVEVAFVRIKEGKTKDLILQIRKEKDKAKRNELKAKLPSYCFGGEFSHRSVSGLKTPSGLCCIDFDNFESTKEAKDFKDFIKDCPFIFAAFISPSGLGVKGLVKIPIVESNDEYNAYFSSIGNFFGHPKWDNNNNGIGRVCYESYDPEIYVNHNSQVWESKEIEEVEELGVDEAIIPVTSENRIISNLLVWFNKKYPMVSGNRNNNLIKLAFALNDFGISKREAENVLSQFETSDFKASEISAICNSAYKRTMNFGTKFFEDVEERSRIEKMVKNGKKEGDIIREFQSFDRGQIKRVIESVKDVITVDNFWTFTNNGSVKVSPHKYKTWLESHGYFKFYPEGEGYSFVKKNQNLLEVTDPIKIKDFVLNSLLEDENIGYLPYDYMAGSARYFTSDFLTLLKTEKVDVMKDDEHNCFLYFQNGVVNVKRDKIEVIDYIDVNGLVWANQIVNRNFTKSDSKGDFRRFIWLLAGEEPERFESLCSVIGYLCHNHNDPSNMKAVIINDEGINENPNGGSGKSLLAEAIGKVRRVGLIDGKYFDFHDKFRFQTIHTDTQVAVFDDVLKNFNFEMLFSSITQGLLIEYKNKPAIKLSKANTPKIIITTNYTVGGVGGSYARRKHEVEVSAYFNNLRTPVDEFGRLFFDGWDVKEWSKFDNFIIECIQLYLNVGLVKHDFKNLEVRKFIKETSFEFYEWVNEEDNLPLNTRINKSEKYETICQDYPDLRKWLTQKRFSLWLERYAMFKGYRHFSGKSNAVRWIEFETPGKVAEEPDDFNALADEIPDAF